MTGSAATLFSGLVLGLAGSLHCACMCGGIASGGLFILNPKTPAERIAMLLKLQAGRILCYAIAGAVIASVASLSVVPSMTSTTYRLLQWAGAAVLMWVGLSMTGLVPSLALPSDLGQLPRAMDRVLTPLRRHPSLMPYALGVTWGMTPCPMVYAALFSAALTGSGVMGFVWMAGFGLGTVPAVVATALGVSTLSRVRKSRAAEAAAGLAIAAFAMLTVTGAWPKIAAFCGII